MDSLFESLRTLDLTPEQSNRIDILKDFYKKTERTFNIKCDSCGFKIEGFINHLGEPNNVVYDGKFFPRQLSVEDFETFKKNCPLCLFTIGYNTTYNYAYSNENIDVIKDYILNGDFMGERRDYGRHK